MEIVYEGICSLIANKRLKIELVSVFRNRVAHHTTTVTQNFLHWRLFSAKSKDWNFWQFFRVKWIILVSKDW